jgi:hypothetical protein
MIPQMIRGPRTASATATQPAGRTCAPSQTRVSVLACEGRLTDADRDRIHDHLREAFSGLDRLYGKAAISSPTSAMTMATAAAPRATAAQSIVRSLRWTVSTP